MIDTEEFRQFCVANAYVLNLYEEIRKPLVWSVFSLQWSAIGFAALVGRE